MDRALWRWFINRRAALSPSNFMNFFSRPENYCYYSYYDHYHYPRTSESGSPGLTKKQQPRKNELGRRRREYQSLINIINNKADEIRAQVPGWPDRGQPAHPGPLPPGEVSLEETHRSEMESEQNKYVHTIFAFLLAKHFSAPLLRNDPFCLSFESFWVVKSKLAPRVLSNNTSLLINFSSKFRRPRQTHVWTLVSKPFFCQYLF